MKLWSKAENAAHTVMTLCLNLPKCGKVVIFCDEITYPAAKILAETSLSLGLFPLVVFFTSQMQTELGDRLPEDYLDFISTAAAVMVCLNGSEQCFDFRDKIRQFAWQTGCKVAHMPGINQRTLLIANVDYPLLSTRCELLALAMAKGGQIKIHSWDSKSNLYILEVDLEPWIRLPIISDGIIQKGSWGNVPSGETYIAPPERTAEGQIVINGSIPGYHIKQGEEIVLTFQSGKLVDWTPRTSPAARHLEQYIISFAQSKNDTNWNIIGEIGIGVNPKVRGLTGNPLLDEKKYGSLHIALGDNTDMGGSNRSSIHCDMICLKPKVWIDDLPVMRNGRIVINSKDWREDYHQLKPPSDWSSNTVLQTSAILTEVDEHAQLKRVWHTGSGRTCSVPVGDEESAKLARKIYKLLDKHGKQAQIGEIARQLQNLPPEDILKLAYLLQRYGLIITQSL